MAGGEAKLGPWQDANLAETARLNAGVGMGADLPASTRFISGVFTLLARRRALAEQLGSEPAVFVLSPVPPSIATEAKRVPMLSNGLTPVEGRVWFVNAPLFSGHFVDRTATDDDGLFRLVTEELGVGAKVTIVFDPRVPAAELRYYPNGLDAPDNCELIGFTKEITLDSLVEAIDRIHHNCFVTPGANGGLWRKASKWRPRNDAEFSVQRQLKAGLFMRFGCEVRSELEGVTGRVDLAILERDPLTRSVTVEHAVIELKVLRSYGEGGASFSLQTVVGWIRDGINQAASYRDERGSRLALLACFDMRKMPEGDLCFEAVREEARASQVVTKAWIVFASAKLFRDYLLQRRLS